MFTLDYNTIYLLIMIIGAVIVLITALYLEKFRIVYCIFLIIGLLMIIVPPAVYYFDVMIYKVS